MKTVKQPKWDKQEGAPIILADPDGPNKNPPFNEPLRVGQRATGTIDGVEVVVLLTDILTTVKAQGQVIGIFDGQNERDAIGDLCLGDIVFIERKDIYSLDIDTDIAR